MKFVYNNQHGTMSGSVLDVIRMAHITWHQLQHLSLHYIIRNVGNWCCNGRSNCCCCDSAKILQRQHITLTQNIQLCITSLAKRVSLYTCNWNQEIHFAQQCHQELTDHHCAAVDLQYWTWKSSWICCSCKCTLLFAKAVISTSISNVIVLHNHGIFLCDGNSAEFIPTYLTAALFLANVTQFDHQCEYHVQHSPLDLSISYAGH